MDWGEYLESYIQYMTLKNISTHCYILTKPHMYCQHLYCTEHVLN